MRMRLKRFAIYMLLLIFISTIYPTIIRANDVFNGYNQGTIYEVNTPEKCLEYANNDMLMLYNQGEYYKSEDLNRKYMNFSLSTKHLYRNTEYYKDLYFVYGYSKSDLKLWNGVNEQRYLGYDVQGNTFENPNFPWDYWDGIELQKYEYINKPWDKLLVRTKYNINHNDFNGRKPDFKKYNPLLKINNLEQNIQRGLDIFYGQKTGKDKVYDCPPEYADRPLFTPGSKPLDPTSPTGYGLWVDFVQIIQPPTYFSWGTGWIFRDYDNDGNVDVYMTVPIAPFVLMSADPVNLKAQVISAPTEGYTGTTVTVKVQSTVEGTQEVIKTTAQWYQNDAAIPGYRNDAFVLKESRNSSITLKLPDTPGTLRVGFKINDNQDQPADEPTYEDNMAAVEITVLERPQENTEGGDVSVNIVKLDGLNKFGYDPQWSVDMYRGYQDMGYPYRDVFDLALMDKSCYPDLNGRWDEIIDFNYLLALVENSRKYRVDVSYTWNQTYHKEWQVVGSHEEEIDDYTYDFKTSKWIKVGSHTVSIDDCGWVDVADPEPTAYVTLDTSTWGSATTQINYNIASGEDALIETQQKASSDSVSFAINPGETKSFYYSMPLYSQVYPNAYAYFDESDSGVAVLSTQAAVSVPAKNCSSCSKSITYNQPGAAYSSKNISIKPVKVFPHYMHLGE